MTYNEACVQLTNQMAKLGVTHNALNFKLGKHWFPRVLKKDTPRNLAAIQTALAWIAENPETGTLPVNLATIQKLSDLVERKGVTKNCLQQSFGVSLYNLTHQQHMTELMQQRITAAFDWLHTLPDHNPEDPTDTLEEMAKPDFAELARPILQERQYSNRPISVLALVNKVRQARRNKGVV